MKPFFLWENHLAAASFLWAVNHCTFLCSARVAPTRAVFAAADLSAIGRFATLLACPCVITHSLGPSAYVDTPTGRRFRVDKNCSMCRGKRCVHTVGETATGPGGAKFMHGGGRSSRGPGTEQDDTKQSGCHSEAFPLDQRQLCFSFSKPNVPCSCRARG